MFRDKSLWAIGRNFDGLASAYEGIQLNSANNLGMFDDQVICRIPQINCFGKEIDSHVQLALNFSKIPGTKNICRAFD